MSNPFDVVRAFEERMKEYTGAPYAVAVDSCTSALFLSMYWLRPPERRPATTVQIPKRTFLSVPYQAIECGYPIEFVDRPWRDWYWLYPLPIIDSACFLARAAWDHFKAYRQADGFRGQPDDYSGNTYACLSFQSRKHLPIGRGGMILHDDEYADGWFRKARFYGRAECELKDDPGPNFLGWRKYMLPEEAARGLTLMMHAPDRFDEFHNDYPDLSQMPVFLSDETKVRVQLARGPIER